jgi:type IV pilus assembly protein PilX
MNRPPIFHCPCTRHQRGIVLVVALILLLVVALSGLAVMRGTIMQNKMSANFYDREIAFQAAQTALREGEVKVQNAPGGAGEFRDCSTTTTLCPLDPFTALAAKDDHIKTALFDPGALAAGQPQYVVEYLGNFNAAASGGCSGSDSGSCGGTPTDPTDPEDPIGPPEPLAPLMLTPTQAVCSGSNYGSCGSGGSSSATMATTTGGTTGNITADYYRITARSGSVDGRAVVILQSIYRR